MAPGSQAPADVPAGRSGGKILKTRRTAARKTPYDRPTPPQPEPPLPQSESPSWLGGLALPAKFVAGGASKIFSSFWNPKTWATASSSSDSDSESEDDSGDDETPSDELIELNQGNSSQKTEVLHLVEQLLMLERYSREECDRLIEIINSRVSDCSTKEGVDAGPSMINNENSDAIMEARKWVAENKARSDKKSDMENGFYALKYIMTTSQATEEEPGSPVEVAKSYMRTRPLWASPLTRDKSLTPSPLATDLFKERTPYSSESTKRDYLSGGSWNIHDEIRRLRSKATEDMLNSHRSTTITSSLLENDNLKNSLPNDKSENQTSTFETPKMVVDLTEEDDDTPDLRTMGNEDADREEERDEHENDKMVSDLEKNCYVMTESAEIPNSQDSSNTNVAGDGGTENQAVVATRATTRNTRRGRGRGGK